MDSQLLKRPQQIQYENIESNNLLNNPQKKLKLDEAENRNNELRQIKQEANMERNNVNIIGNPVVNIQAPENGYMSLEDELDLEHSYSVENNIQPITSYQDINFSNKANSRTPSKDALNEKELLKYMAKERTVNDKPYNMNNINSYMASGANKNIYTPLQQNTNQYMFSQQSNMPFSGQNMAPMAINKTFVEDSMLNPALSCTTIINYYLLNSPNPSNIVPMMPQTAPITNLGLPVPCSDNIYIYPGQNYNSSWQSGMMNYQGSISSFSSQIS